MVSITEGHYYYCLHVPLLLALFSLDFSYLGFWSLSIILKVFFHVTVNPSLSIQFQVHYLVAGHYVIYYMIIPTNSSHPTIFIVITL